MKTNNNLKINIINKITFSLKTIAIIIIVFSELIQFSYAQNAVITESPGLLPLNNQVFYFNYPYIFHGGTGTSINKYNINDFSDVTSNITTYTYSSFGLGSTKNNGFEYIVQGSTFYKINLTTGARSNLQAYPCIFTNERATIVNDGLNYIYVFGGRLGGTPLSNQLWRYDIANNLWFQLSTAPYGMSFNTGAFIYPYIYSGGGKDGTGIQNNGIQRFNILDNTWSSVTYPPSLGPGSGAACVYEVYFEYNNELYCLIPGESSLWPLSVHKYNSVIDVWNQLTLNNFPGGIANIGSNGVSPLTRIISIGNGNFIFSKNGVWNSFNGQSNCYTLSLANKQTHIKINSTDCLDTLTASNINLHYSVQFSGAYTNCSINIKIVNGANNMVIRSLTNVSVSGQQVSNFSDLIPFSYKNGHIEVDVIENGTTTNSINKYPINKNISYSISGSISSSNPLSICLGTPIGTVLNTANTPGNTYQWYFNGNIINGATSINYTALQLGQYSCMITAPTGCQTQPVVNYQQFSIPITPTITANGPTTFCSGGSVNLTSSSPTGNTWSNGATSQTISVASSGNYTVTVSNGACSATSIPTTVTNNSPTTPTISANGATTFCAGGSVNLSSSSPTGNTWSNGATSQTISVASSGNYSVTVTSGGCSATSIPTAVTVNPLPPTPIITANGATTFCAGVSSVNLTSSSPTGNTWSSGATIQTISVAFSGNYSVTVTSGGCSATSIPTVVTVNSLPSIPIITANGPTTFCSGGSVNLTSSSPTGNTWSNGATSQTISVASSGNISVTVSNGACSATSIPTAVTVNALPSTPTITANGPTTFCSGGSVNLTSSSPTGNTWSNGATSQTISVASSGNYSVTVSNGACSATSTPTTVTNNTTTTPTISANGATTFCAGGSVNLTSSSPTGNTWSNGATSQTISVASSGNYSVTVSTGACSATSTPTAVTVNALPATPTITAIGNTTFCAGDSVLLASSSFNGNLWSNNLTSQSIYVSQSGLFSVQNTDNNGCVSISSPILINVLPLPQISIVTSGPTTICQGDAVTLTASPSNSYFWSNGSINQSISVNQTGVYSVSVIGSNSCNNTSSPINVIVNNNTSSNLTETAIDSYNWPLNNQTYTQSGTYTATIPNAAGCDSVVTMNLTLNFNGISENSGAQISISPNPASSKINVKSNIALIGSKFIIYDELGKEVKFGKITSIDNEVDISNLNNGVYLFKIGVKQIGTFKIIKE